MINCRAQTGPIDINWKQPVEFWIFFWKKSGLVGEIIQNPKKLFLGNAFVKTNGWKTKVTLQEVKADAAWPLPAVQQN